MERRDVTSGGAGVAGVRALVLTLTLALSGLGPAPALAGDGETIPSGTQALLQLAVGKWIESKAEGTENQFGKKTVRGYSSRDFDKAGDNAYQVTAHLERAGHDVKTTERYLLTLTPSGKDWTVSNAELKDTFQGLFRATAGRCFDYASMSLDREGLEVSSGPGQLCATYYQGRVVNLVASGQNMKYSFEVPDHAVAYHLIPDFHALYATVAKNHERELKFDPAGYIISCDAQSCEEILQQHFTGLNVSDVTTAPPVGTGDGTFKLESKTSWIGPLWDQVVQDRKENPFAHFIRPIDEGRGFWQVYILREISPFAYFNGDEISDVPSNLPGPGVSLTYDSWGGYELEFSVWPRRLDVPDQLYFGVYGYYSEETLANNSPYEIETRDDEDARWHEVKSVRGEVDLAVQDAEVLSGDLEIGIVLKQPVRVLPFFIQAIPRQEFTGNAKPRELFVNSVQLEGQELTWTKTSQLGGLVVLPQEMPAGSELKLRMNFDTRALYKVNSTFTYVSRFGWIPFVRFGDFIDDFEMTLRNPEGYKVLGIGKKISEKTENGVVVTHWKADSAVVFPSVAMGRYQEDTPGEKFELPKRSDGTEIPVTVHVDKNSFTDWGISPKSLRPIAQQAVNAINLYTELSGIDYPYGELNFVNDPLGFLYGQAPSSLIYLGSGVFRGAGFLASLGFRDATAISKFLKSVTAHEVGHQWWGSRVSNANGRNYWFVESLAEYFSALYLEAVFGKQAYEEQVEEWRAVILDNTNLSSVQNANSLWSDGSRTALLYNKGPLMFHMLREIYGDEKFMPALKEMSLELAEKREIVSLDIQNALSRALGGVDENGNRYNADLEWFFDQWLRGSSIPEYAMTYNTRQSEDGSWIIEGVIKQRLKFGSKWENATAEQVGTFRTLVDLTVKVGGETYRQKLVVENAETPFQLKVPGKPVTVELNAGNTTLAFDVETEQPW